MKVLFISLNRESINMRVVPLGLACVAQSAIDAGHSVRILDLLEVDNISNSVKAEIYDFDPDIIGLSIRNIDNQDMKNTEFYYKKDRKIIKEIKNYSKSIVVLGGAGYSIYPDIILKDTGADFGIQGEGEKIFPLLLEKLSHNNPLNNIPQLYFNNGHQGKTKYIKTNLDKFPLPSPKLFWQFSEKHFDDLWIPVQTRRGCPLSCSYCSTALIEGKIIRKRDPLKIVKWLKELEDYGINNFYFVDNTFNIPESYALELCKAIIDAKLKIKWRCIIYPYKLSEKLCNAVAKTGCCEVSLGFESVNDVVLKGMNKLYCKTDIEEASKNLKKYGIKRVGFLMLGAPFDNVDSIKESLDFADSLELDALKITTGIRIYPYTKLAEQALIDGIINKNDNLLTPRFYISTSLKNNICEIITEFKSQHPYCI